MLWEAVDAMGGGGKRWEAMGSDGRRWEAMGGGGGDGMPGPVPPRGSGTLQRDAPLSPGLRCRKSPALPAPLPAALLPPPAEQSRVWLETCGDLSWLQPGGDAGVHLR